MAQDSDGAAFVFVRDETGWTQQARLHLPFDEAGEGDFFGRSLSVQGDVLAVGAPRRGNGSVHIFERTGTEWARTAVVEPAHQQSDSEAEFGHQVALDGDRLAVAARGDASAATGVGGDPTNEDAPFSGAVHVYVRDGAGWTLEAYIKPSNTREDHAFGSSLALSGTTLAAGSRDDSSATGVNGDQENTDSPGSGAVFVFRRRGSRWAQEAYVKASNTGAGDSFGVSTRPGRALDLLGSRVAVGATGEDSAATGVGGDQQSNEAQNSGAVYVFTRRLGVWSQEAYVKASNSGAGDSFGHMVALSGSRLFVSAPLEDSDADGFDGDQADEAAPDAGAAYLFRRQTSWAQIRYIKASNSAAGDGFGWGAAAEGIQLAAGAPAQFTCPDPDPENLCLNIGAAYVFQ